VLAVVQDQERSLIAQALGDGLGLRPARLLAHAQDARDRALHQLRLRESSQLYEPDPIRVATDEVGGDFQGEAGLARAANPRQGEESCPGEGALDPADFAAPAHETGSRSGKVVLGRFRYLLRWRSVGERRFRREPAGGDLLP
jgi:hypothetical protein